MNEYDYEVTPKYLSLGAGVQSTTLLAMSVALEVDRLRGVIFADTGWEPKAVYETVDWCEAMAKAAGIDFYRVSAGNIRDDAVAGTRSASLPVTTKDEDGGVARLRRQCTHEYKIAPIQKKLRELGATAKNPVDLWLGISLDEVQRMKPSRVKYVRHKFPLVDRRMTRHDCLMWLQRQRFPLPARSACIGCPFHDDATWRKMRDESPEEWADACEFDESIRRLPRIDSDCYLHRTAVPLSDVDLCTPQDHGQLDLWPNECEGYCGY